MIRAWISRSWSAQSVCASRDRTAVKPQVRSRPRPAAMNYHSMTACLAVWKDRRHDVPQGTLFNLRPRYLNPASDRASRDAECDSDFGPFGLQFIAQSGVNPAKVPRGSHRSTRNRYFSSAVARPFRINVYSPATSPAELKYTATEPFASTVSPDADPTGMSWSRACRWRAIR